MAVAVKYAYHTQSHSIVDTPSPTQERAVSLSVAVLVLPAALPSCMWS